LRAPTVAPTARAESVGTRITVTPDSPIVSRGANEPRTTHMVAAPTSAPSCTEATRMAPPTVTAKVTGIPTMAKVDVPTVQRTAPAKTN
jgi:hypothetical protein